MSGAEDGDNSDNNHATSSLAAAYSQTKIRGSKRRSDVTGSLKTPDVSKRRKREEKPTKPDKVVLGGTPIAKDKTKRASSAGKVEKPERTQDTEPAATDEPEVAQSTHTPIENDEAEIGDTTAATVDSSPAIWSPTSLQPGPIMAPAKVDSRGRKKKPSTSKKPNYAHYIHELWKPGMGEGRYVEVKNKNVGKPGYFYDGIWKMFDMTFTPTPDLLPP